MTLLSFLTEEDINKIKCPESLADFHKFEFPNEYYEEINARAPFYAYFFIGQEYENKHWIVYQEVTENDVMFKMYSRYSLEKFEATFYDKKTDFKEISFRFNEKKARQRFEEFHLKNKSPGDSNDSKDFEKNDESPSVYIPSENVFKLPDFVATAKEKGINIGDFEDQLTEEQIKALFTLKIFKELFDLCYSTEKNFDCTALQQWINYEKFCLTDDVFKITKRRKKGIFKDFLHIFHPDKLKEVAKIYSNEENGKNCLIHILEKTNAEILEEISKLVILERGKFLPVEALDLIRI